MSKSAETVSEKGQDEPESDSILDFLYCDTRRIGSFLAQFDDAGHLQQVIQRESAAKGVKRGLEISVGGGATLAGTGGSGNLAVRRAPSEAGSEGSERVYDPLWTNARAFMDYLDERKMIGHELSKARMGQFILISGALEIRDLKVVKDVMSVLKHKRSLQQKPKHGKPQAQPNDDGTFALELLTMLPYAMHAVLKLDGESVWCSLNHDYLLGSSDDIFLKYGISISGEWSMLGILDALPDKEAVAKGPEEQLAAARAQIAELGTNNEMRIVTKGFGGLVDGVAPYFRMLLGRQLGSYGMTPLLIFRRVAS